MITWINEVVIILSPLHFCCHHQVIRSSSKLSKIFLAAMVHELYKTGMGETTFEKVFCMYIQVIMTTSALYA